LIEIIAGATAQYALDAIARRRPLSGEVSDVIVSSLDIPAVAALLANPHAEIREQTLDKLAESAERIEDLHHPLTLRTDLSMRTLRRLASFVGTALLESLTIRDGLDEDTKVFLNRRLRTRLKKDDSRDPVFTDAVNAVALAVQDGYLDDEFVETVADAGNKEAVIVALATLAQVPPPIVRRIIEAHSAKAIVALVWRARLSMRVAFKIQAFVARLTPKECLAARNGKDFPLSEDEMRWQLSYFDVS
jgi:uncharacterized protein (DUF2336 family)